jgi:hypothetical protein
MTNNLPTQAEIFTNALDALHEARLRLSDARDWLNSDWKPGSPSLPQAAADARHSVKARIGSLKNEIDAAKNEIAAALEALDARR